MDVISIDVSEVLDLSDDIVRNVAIAEAKGQLIIEKTAEDTVALAQELAPVKTGNLRNSISSDTGWMEFEAGSTAEYGWYVEGGTQAHVIKAKDGGFLEFTVNGHKVSVKEVHHPGTAPQPFMAPAADVTFPDAVDAFADLGLHVLDRGL